MRFDLLTTDGAARRGQLTTAHGTVDTPVFMPVGTQATVKGLTPEDLAAAGASIVLANTYHLFLRPGHELVRALGGLHRFMAWPGAILTDSGGFQVWSLAKLRKISDDGVEFRAPLDGATRFLSPELVIDIQRALGADIAMVLDECLAYPATRETAERSLARTLAWAERCRAAHARVADGQALFGIVQGGTDDELRARAAAATVALDFDGYAIGGMAVGEPKPRMYALTEQVARALPAGRPRYLMGVGKPEDLVEGVARGVDMFDCVLPTRNARNGQAFTSTGTVTIKQARWTHDPAPLDTRCGCYTCRQFSRAYLRHLYVAEELLAYRLLTLHNVHFYLGLMAAMRDAIAAHAFEAFRARFYARYAVSSVDVPLDDPQRSEA
ncbi:MAG TPA: tRNA guanosine(34) transglycosylase Tgt [Methylomirabilota bacterium]|nr:tRNA guanosine(34) transglycosylase Tgt [Methylomirabilota bacterium]